MPFQGEALLKQKVPHSPACGQTSSGLTSKGGQKWTTWVEDPLRDAHTAEKACHHHPQEHGPPLALILDCEPQCCPQPTRGGQSPLS